MSLDINTARSYALFVSPLQRSDCPNMDQLRDAITNAIRRLGRYGCLCRVAQEIGEHPETALPLRWARKQVDRAFTHGCGGWESGGQPAVRHANHAPLAAAPAVRPSRRQLRRGVEGEHPDD